MKSVKNNPFKDLVLDPEEAQINRAVESGKVKVQSLTSREKKSLQDAARATLDKLRNINIRLSGRTLFDLKAKAAAEGIPYQTLAASILHKYAQGTL